jgi:hypothetical protein
MAWVVLFDDQFAKEMETLEESVRLAIFKHARALELEGPKLSRPFADTLNGSKHTNMKELRPTVKKVEWRVAFAFDPQRQAVLLVADAKGGESDARFYKRLISKADQRFDVHLTRLKEVKTKD